MSATQPPGEAAGRTPDGLPAGRVAPEHGEASSAGGPVEERLEDIIATILEFAEQRFEARARVGLEGDIVDAVAAGVNFLGEELEASFGDLERRVAERTAELVDATAQLAHRALHDELTDLANRTLFYDRLEHRVSTAARRPHSFAVLYADLDGFKAVNDVLGHATGDRLLIEVATRIRTALRAGDSAARFGGDEFLVILDEVDSPAAAAAIADRLGQALRQPYRLGTQTHIATASIGIATNCRGAVRPDTLVAAADKAMYEAKRRGGDQCVDFDDAFG